MPIMKLKGLVANGFDGEIEGVCRIVFVKDISSFKEGEILVTDSTSPHFLSVMTKAKAIITEMGGLLSHSAIASRELNKPCIIRVAKATEILKNGMKVTIKNDGSVIIDGKS